jgi:replicative DNA helicase
MSGKTNLDLIDLPESKDAERVILGAIILDNQLMRQTAALSVSDFAAPFHRAVFAAMLELDEENRPIDPILIYEIIRRDQPETDWMAASVTNLTYGLPHFSSLREYTAVVKETAAAAAAIKKLERLQQLLADRKLSIKDFCRALSHLESDLRGSYAEETDSFKTLGEVFQSEVLPTLDAYYREEASEFLISTGFPQIDEILGGGLYLTDMLAIVAPPKSAKSSFALQLALNIADRGETVGLLSLEMSNLQNGLRFIAQKSYTDSIKENGNPSAAIHAGWLRPGIFATTYRHAVETAMSLFDTKLLLCQKPLDWRELQAETRRLVKEKNLRVLIVDYWQLVSNDKRGQTRADSLADIAKGLKKLGQELNICVIALGQFNQEGLKMRESGKELSAMYLEGSGELVKSANIVLTIDIKEADLTDPNAPRVGTLTFRPLRSAADARLGCLFFGKYLTVEIQ